MNWRVGDYVKRKRDGALGQIANVHSTRPSREHWLLSVFWFATQSYETFNLDTDEIRFYINLVPYIEPTKHQEEGLL